MGLGRYYETRMLDPGLHAPRPERTEPRGLDRFIRTGTDGLSEIALAIDGLQCGACVWLIESVLAREPDVVSGRVNMTTRRLKLVWRGGVERAGTLQARIEALGYRLVPYDPACLEQARDRDEERLLRALAVAGFAASNVMLMSIGNWVGLTQGMGAGTRAMLHWVSALIALPAIAYAGMPFFGSAFAALRAGRTNMDVPIGVGVTLVTAMSLAESFRGGLHTYFDSAVTLLFFLLIGRVLDHRARGRARRTAEQLLILRTGDVALLGADGTVRRVPADCVAPGDRLLVGMGERIGADGSIENGAALIDASLVTGEALPISAKAGTLVFAGMLNLGEPLILRANATGDATLLAECVRLIEAAESRRGRFVALADRVARRYAPAVHLCALFTFLLWWLALKASLTDSLLTASAVLIITCPCALALAVPAVQVIATTRLMSKGILLKSGTALERLAEVDTVVFDKTGTLTEPTLALVGVVDADSLAVAARLAAASRHPLARALVAAAGPVVPAEAVTERPGQGLSVHTPAGETRLGSRAFCRVEGMATASELWLTRPGVPPVSFVFEERLRRDAVETASRLGKMGFRLVIASGDQPGPVDRVARALGISEAHAACDPVDKAALLRDLAEAGRRVLMVGDGLNDGPCLAEASVSASPATAADISQTVADVVFQGIDLAPVADVLVTARMARRVIRQNLAMSIGYNMLALPLAVGGLVTPWLAALAMSSSSLLVIVNSFRLERVRRR